MHNSILKRGSFPVDTTSGTSYDNCSDAFRQEKQNISFGQIGHKINWMGQRISGKYVNTKFSRGKLRKVLDSGQLFSFLQLSNIFPLYSYFKIRSQIY